jgi:dihydrofolate reductase
MRIVIMNHVTLDGVMQGPGRPDEDRRGGFQHGGWATARSDEVVARAMAARMGRSGGLLLGRRTYEDLLSHWNSAPDNPFREPLNAAQKWVVSATLEEPLPWPNSTLLTGDVVEGVRRLKAEGDGDLGVMGSGQLVRSLLPHGLIDEFLLFIHPLVLGSGQRLFPEDGPTVDLELVEAVTATTGVIVAAYRPAG